jgi:alpha-amylase/alpha-mannosidase (GH57 family)
LKGAFSRLEFKEAFDSSYRGEVGAHSSTSRQYLTVALDPPNPSSGSEHRICAQSHTDRVSVNSSA